MCKATAPEEEFGRAMIAIALMHLLLIV